jgi:protein-S-isoprenylcysteine O-methyltransferase Ste14
VEWIRWAAIVGCWGAFGIVWLVGAIYNYTHAPAIERRGNPLSVWLIGLASILIIATLVPTGFWQPLTVHAAWLVLLGAAALVVSTVFTLWARFVLGTMWTATAAQKAGHVLHTEGPYGITRHPIYTGILGMFIGAVMLSGLGVYLVYLVVLIAVLVAKMAAEERLLTETLGERYLRYKARVPQLIPGLGALQRKPAS